MVYEKVISIGGVMKSIIINKCKCGQQPYYSGQYENGVSYWEVRCLECGLKSHSRTSKEECAKEWNIGIFNDPIEG